MDAAVLEVAEIPGCERSVVEPGDSGNLGIGVLDWVPAPKSDGENHRILPGRFTIEGKHSSVEVLTKHQLRTFLEFSATPPNRHAGDPGENLRFIDGRRTQI
jgi:hypothetical protein